MEQTDVIDKVIRVESVEDTEKRVVLECGNEKYSFYKRKQDGELTKAFSQFQELRVSSGNQYQINVSETKKSFTNDQGKLINYTERLVKYFITNKETYNKPNPTAPDPVPQAPQVSPDALKDLEKRVAILENIAGVYETDEINPDLF
jgi:hypothetical protein